MKSKNSYSMISAAAIALVAGATLLLAQWPKNRTAGPRTETGELDMKAPAPKAADGHPDLSGLWQPMRGGGGGRGNAKGKGAPVVRAPGEPPAAQFGDLGVGFEKGLPYTEWGRKTRDDRKANNSKDNPDANCRPLGLMQLHTHPFEKKIVQGNGAIVIMYNANNDVRQILTNGQALPQVGPSLAPWWYGYSVGQWEGDTLVVNTVGFRDDVWLDVNGSPLTSSGKMVERFTRLNFGTLRIDVTIEDPKAYTEPFTVRVMQQLMPDTELFESVCEDRDATHYVGASEPAKPADQK
ncbi:MAG TPA: hypothetical protein VGN17_09255 [Bryobacteraceae bacterium]|jgi:hypothetical protein